MKYGRNFRRGVPSSRDMDGSPTDSFPCPRCGDRIPADAGFADESQGEASRVRRAICPSCKEPLIRPEHGESPWELQD